MPHRVGRDADRQRLSVGAFNDSNATRRLDRHSRCRACRSGWTSSVVVIESCGILSSRHGPVNRGNRMLALHLPGLLADAVADAVAPFASPAPKAPGVLAR